MPSENATVDRLFDGEARWWNSNLIDQNFLPLEAKKIKSIPICSSPQKDVLFLATHKLWHILGEV